MPSPRRFPPPWPIEELNAAFSDANGQQLAYVYFEKEPGRRAAAKLLTKDEARRIAANIATLPDSRVLAHRGVRGQGLLVEPTPVGLGSAATLSSLQHIQTKKPRYTTRGF